MNYIRSLTDQEWEREQEQFLEGARRYMNNQGNVPLAALLTRLEENQRMYLAHNEIEVNLVTREINRPVRTFVRSMANKI